MRAPASPSAPATTPDGTLLWAIYQKGALTDRVAGAVVSVAGKSVTTGADGMYRFRRRQALKMAHELT